MGGIAFLEYRAFSPSYQGMLNSLVDIIAPEKGASPLEVDRGSGAVAHRLGSANSLTAVNVNPFRLREAATLAARMETRT